VLVRPILPSDQRRSCRISGVSGALCMARPTILRIAKSFDKKFWIAPGIFLDSIIYDAELTRQRLAHHRCVEDTLTGQHSPRAEIYGNNLLEQFLPLTFMQRALGKYVWKGQRYEGATLGSVIHFRGGTQWLTSGCR